MHYLAFDSMNFVFAQYMKNDFLLTAFLRKVMAMADLLTL